MIFIFEEFRFFELRGGAILSPTFLPQTQKHTKHTSNNKQKRSWTKLHGFNALSQQIQRFTTDLTKMKVKVGCTTKFQEEEVGRCEFYDAHSYNTTGN